MPYRIENVETGVWHRVMRDLTASGFATVYRYEGADAGIDYGRYDLRHPAGGEPVVFEWDNWAEGSIRAAPPLLEAIRVKYRLAEIVEVGGGSPDDKP